jgi:hypothetical protein
MRVFLRGCFFLCALMTAQVAPAQPDSLWSVRFYEANLVVPTLYAAVELADGGFVVVGASHASTTSDTTFNAFAARLTAAGVVSWSRVWGSSSGEEVATAVVETSNGNLMVVGYGGSGVNPNLVMIWGLSGSGDSLWSRSYGSSGWTQGNGACRLPDGNVAIVGFRPGADTLRLDVWLLKCAPNGDTLWTRTIGGSNTDMGNCILPGPNNELIIGASTRTYGAGDYDVWLLRTDSLGQVISSQTAGTAGVERCYGMFKKDGTIYVTGIASNASGSESDGYLVEGDLTGQVTRAQAYSGGLANEVFRGAALRFDGAVRCVGWAGSGAANPKPWIANISPNGVLEESKIYSGFQQGQFYGIIPAASGGGLIFGTVTEGGHHEGYVFRIGSGAGIAGTVTEADLGEPLEGIRVQVEGGAQSTLTDPQGRFHLEIRPGTYRLIASGVCVSNDTSTEINVVADSTVTVDMSVGVPRYVSAQTSVNIVAYNRIPGSGAFVIYNRGSGRMDFSTSTEAVSPAGNWLSASPEQGTVPPHDSVIVEIIVHADEPNTGVYDYFGYLNVRAHSCPDSTDRVCILATILGADERDQVAPADFALHAAYPNPLNAVTMITYDLPKSGHVSLRVFDLLGHEVAVLKDDFVEAGTHCAIFDGSGSASGSYFARLETSGFTATEKMLLLK